MEKTSIVFLFLSLFACQGREDSLTYLSSRSDSFSSEQRQALFPNELFIALVDQENEQTLQKIIDKNGYYLTDLNEDGDTALAIAIKFYNLKRGFIYCKAVKP